MLIEVVAEAHGPRLHRADHHEGRQGHRIITAIDVVQSRSARDPHRQTLLWKCGGLTAEQLKLRAIERSDLSLLGLVRHMAEVERDWFRTRFAGAQVGYLYCTVDNMQAEFDVADADAESDLAVYAREVEAVRQTTQERSLDETFVDPNRKTEMSLRFVYSVMIQEYARHNGHADLLRESVDGQTGH